jgi:hypothetical protein
MLQYRFKQQSLSESHPPSTPLQAGQLNMQNPAYGPIVQHVLQQVPAAGHAYPFPVQGGAELVTFLGHLITKSLEPTCAKFLNWLVL